MNNRNIDIEPRNDKGQRHGYWEVYWSNINNYLFYKGNYIDGEKDGYWEGYHSGGTLRYKDNYVNGHRHGFCESCSDNGEVYYKGYYDMGIQVDYEVLIDTPSKEMFPIY